MCIAFVQCIWIYCRSVFNFFLFGYCFLPLRCESPFSLNFPCQNDLKRFSMMFFFHSALPYQQYCSVCIASNSLLNICKFVNAHTGDYIIQPLWTIIFLFSFCFHCVCTWKELWILKKLSYASTNNDHGKQATWTTIEHR